MIRFIQTTTATTKNRIADAARAEGCKVTDYGFNGIQGRLAITGSDFQIWNLTEELKIMALGHYTVTPEARDIRGL